MRTLISVLLIGIPFLFTAQDWPLPDSQWFYSKWSIDTGGTELVTVTGDTIIADKAYKKLMVHHTSIWDTPNGVVTSSSDELLGFMRQSGDSVFHLEANNEEFLLYDFNAEPGDSWLCAANSGMGSDESCSDSAYVHVTNSGSMLVNGVVRRFLELEPNSDSSWGIQGLVIEGIGPTGGSTALGNRMFPFQRCCDSTIVCDFGMTSFNCYTDSEIGLYHPNPFTECLEALSANDLSVNPFLLHHNPSRDFFILAAPESFDFGSFRSVSLLDLMGKTVMSIPVAHTDLRSGAESLSLDIRSIPVGVYFILIETKSRLYSLKAMKK